MPFLPLAVVSSKLSVNCPDSPHSTCGGSALGATFVSNTDSASFAAAALATVLKLVGVCFELKISREGKSVSTILVVRGNSVQSGPVMDGYVPVQKDLVVTTDGVGNTKLNPLSPKAMTLVIRPRVLDWHSEFDVVSVHVGVTDELFNDDVEFNVELVVGVLELVVLAKLVVGGNGGMGGRVVSVVVVVNTEELSVELVEETGVLLELGEMLSLLELS